MQKRRTALMAAICTLVLICVVAGSFLFSSIFYQTDRYKVTLPSQTGSVEELSSGVETEHPSETIGLPELTPQNAQTVIKGLPRPAEYVCTVTNTLYSGEEEAVWKAVTYIRQGVQRVERLDDTGEIAEISLYYGDRISVWEPKSTTYWSTAAGTITADMTAMIPSYRDVCDFPMEAIKQVELTDQLGEPCILIRTEGEQYLISLLNGLLQNAKYYENGELVRMVELRAAEEVPEDALFVLPGASAPVFAQD